MIVSLLRLRWFLLSCCLTGFHYNQLQCWSRGVSHWSRRLRDLKALLVVFSTYCSAGMLPCWSGAAGWIGRPASPQLALKQTLSHPTRTLTSGYRLGSLPSSLPSQSPHTYPCNAFLTAITPAVTSWQPDGASMITNAKVSRFFLLSLPWSSSNSKAASNR